LNLRLDPAVRDQFAIAAKLRGASMSGLLHQFIVRTIREEKAEAPQAFNTKRGVRTAEITLISSPAAEEQHEARQLRKKLERDLHQPIETPTKKRKTG
jgi:hypothetical protein